MSKVLVVEALDQLIGALERRGYTVIGPAVRNGTVLLDEVTASATCPSGGRTSRRRAPTGLRRRDDQAVFGYAVGPESPRRRLSSPRRTLWQATRDDDGFDVHEGAAEPTRYAFPGVRACELAAVGIQDRVFVDGPYPDPAYAAARDEAFVRGRDLRRAGGHLPLRLDGHRPGGAVRPRPGPDRAHRSSSATVAGPLRPVAGRGVDHHARGRRAHQGGPAVLAPAGDHRRLRHRRRHPGPQGTCQRREVRGRGVRHSSFVSTLATSTAIAAQVPADFYVRVDLPSGDRPLPAHARRVNVIVAGKQPALQYLDMDAAVTNCTKGIGIWEWASNDEGADPDVGRTCPRSVAGSGRADPTTAVGPESSAGSWAMMRLCPTAGCLS